MLIDIAIRILESDLVDVEKVSMTELQRNGLLSQLWQNDAFREYIGERDKKIIYSIAGMAGTEPEPRSKTLMKHGQRVEILILGSRAKAAYLRLQKSFEAQRKSNSISEKG